MHISRRRLLSQLRQALLPDETIIWVGRNRSVALTSQFVAATNKRILCAIPGPLVCEFTAGNAAIDMTITEAVLSVLRPGEKVYWTAKQRASFAWVYLLGLHVSVTDRRILLISHQLFSNGWTIRSAKVDLFRNWPLETETPEPRA
jgi:hypothetical protein